MQTTNVEVLQKWQISGIEAFLVKNQLRWVGHVVRMNDDRISKILVYGELPNASRKGGRPPTTKLQRQAEASLKALKLTVPTEKLSPKTKVCGAHNATSL